MNPGRKVSRAQAAIARTVLRLSALLVPRADRSTWLEEWNAELWQIRQRQVGQRSAVRHVLGAIPHAFTLHLENLHMNFSWQDVRYAARSTISGRMTTLVSVLTLALGIGATATVFSLLNGVVLRPLPYPDADRLVALRPESWSSSRMFEFLAAEATSYDALAAWTPGGHTIQEESQSETIVGPRVTADFFDVLGVSAFRGRTLTEGDDRPGASVTLISYDLWQRRFGERDVVGQTVTLSGVTRTIVGVLPPGLDVLQPNAGVVTPVPLDPDLPMYDFQNLRTIVARLAPGVTRATAEAELRVLVQRWAEEAGWDPERIREVTVVSLHEFVVGDVRPMLLLLMGAVACTLLIVVANVTNLQLAQALRRRQEFAIRLALGARPSRLAFQLLSETTLIALGGAMFGTVIGVAAVPALVSLFPGDLPRGAAVRIDTTTLALTAMVGLVTGWLIAGLPVAQALRSELREGLESGSRSATASRSRRLTWSILVGAEIALASTLLIGGGLLIKSFRHTLAVDPGFEPAGLATVSIRPAPGSLEETDAFIQFHDHIDERLRAVPGIVTTAGALAVPILEPGWWFGAYRQGRKPGPNEEWPLIHWRPVTPGYFNTARIRMVRGRGFEESDRATAAPVAVITQRTADEWFGDADPIGQRIVVGVERSTAGPITVVGVAENVRYVGLRDAPAPTIYRPWEQTAETLLRIGADARYAVVRSSRPAAAIAAGITAAIREVAPNASTSPVRPMEETIGRSLTEPRALLILLSFFASVSLALGALGVYGVMAFHVGQRTREMSIRMALGATASRVLGRVLLQSVRLIGTGALAGLVLAFALSRLLEGFLFQVSATDPAVFGAATVVLMVVGVLAAYVPGRRAARLPPIIALRSE